MNSPLLFLSGAGLPAWTSVRSLHTGHLPMLADPGALAAALEELL